MGSTQTHDAHLFSQLSSAERYGPIVARKCRSICFTLTWNRRASGCLTYVATRFLASASSARRIPAACRGVSVNDSRQMSVERGFRYITHLITLQFFPNSSLMRWAPKAAAHLTNKHPLPTVWRDGCRHLARRRDRVPTTVTWGHVGRTATGRGDGVSTTV